LQFCVDFCRLNNLTCKDRYPLPLIDETLARLAKAKVYIKLDIVGGRTSAIRKRPYTNVYQGE